MKFFKPAALFLAATTSLVSPTFAQEITGDTVLATVNGTDITAAHLITLVQRLPENYAVLEDKVLFEALLDQLIQQQLLAETADTTSRALQVSRENEERALLATTALDQLSNSKITDENIKAAYDAEYGNLPEEPEFRASHILVETEEEAKDLLTALEGGKDFAELAKEKSTGPSGANGGDLGWFGKGAMVPEFELAVVNTDVGGVSDPVKTQFGWHVLKVFEKRTKAAPTLEEVRGSIVERLRSAAIDAQISKLEDAAKIDKLDAPADLSFIRNQALVE